MLPDMDGLKCWNESQRRAGPPVLILSARGAVDDRVKGLETGADDYLTKPFRRSWIAGACACTAAARQPSPEKLQVADLVLDCARRKVLRGAEEYRACAQRIRHSGIHDAE